MTNAPWRLMLHGGRTKRKSGRPEDAIAAGSLLDHLSEVSALLKHGSVGLLLDLDGTISEIVPEPEAASVRPAVVAALEKLHRRLALVAILTGRSAGQARDILGLQQLVYVGNHGLERLENGRTILAEESQSFAPFLEQLLARLRPRFPSQGLIFEDKGGSFTIHYRLAVDPGKAREDVLEAIRELAGGQVRVLMGKTVINVLPPAKLNKGTAVISLVKEYGLGGAILIGDDVTDIDSFHAARQLSRRQGFISISVTVEAPDCPAELETEANFSLAGVSEVEDFLAWLAEQTG